MLLIQITFLRRNRGQAGGLATFSARKTWRNPKSGDARAKYPKINLTPFLLRPEAVASVSSVGLTRYFFANTRMLLPHRAL